MEPSNLVMNVAVSEEAVDKWVREQHPKTSKDLRRLQTEGRHRLLQELKDKIAKLYETHGAKLTFSLPPELVSSSTLLRTFGRYDAAKHNLKKTEDGRYFYVEHITARTLPCRVELTDGTVCDPAVIFPADLDFENLSSYSLVTVGGAVKKVEASGYTLPKEIIAKAANTQEYRMSTYMPILAKIPKKGEVLIPAHSVFLKSDLGNGSEVDPSSASEPELSRHQKGEYALSDPMFHSITLVLADIPGFNEATRIEGQGVLAEITPVKFDK